jgi:hypothetical protein
VEPRARPPLRPACLAVDFLRVLVDLRVVDFLRPLLFRAAALPPLRPAWTTDGALRVVFLRPVDLRVVDFLRVPVDFLAVDFLRVLVDLRVVDFLRPEVLRAVARPPLRPAWTTEGALRVVFLRPVDLRVVDFFRVPVDLLAVDFLRPVVLRAVARPPLRPAAARAVDFFRVPVLLRVVDFLRVPVVLLVELLRALLFLPVLFLRPEEDFLLAVDFRGVVEVVLRAVLRVELFRRTGLRVDTPESEPNMSEAVPAAPVSTVRVVGVKSSSEPDTTTPPPSRSPPIGSSRVGSIDPVSSAMTPLSVEFSPST